MATDLVVSKSRVQRAGKSMSRKNSRLMWFYIFVSPFLFGLIFLTIVPLAGGLGISMTNYDGLTFYGVKFVGLGNYLRALQDELVPQAVGRTVIWSVVNAPIMIGFTFVTGVLLNNAMRGRGFFRTALYIPTLIPGVAAVRIITLMLNRDEGIVNGFLSLFVPGTNIFWTSPDYAFVTTLMISTWLTFGGGVVVFLAGLQNVPDELREAALIDGANSFQVFRFVTMPLMTPLIFFQLVTTMIAVFQEATTPMLLWGIEIGRVPPPSVYFIMVHILRQIRLQNRYGYGSALVWIMFVVLILISVLLFWSQRFWVHYEEPVDDKKAKKNGKKAKSSGTAAAMEVK
jgi:multiple sugar transport system permease protein